MDKFFTDSKNSWSPEKPTVISAYQSNESENKPDNPPTTKKCDIEKGEDQKDRRMWNRI